MEELQNKKKKRHFVQFENVNMTTWLADLFTFFTFYTWHFYDDDYEEVHRQPGWPILLAEKLPTCYVKWRCVQPSRLGFVDVLRKALFRDSLCFCINVSPHLIPLGAHNADSALTIKLSDLLKQFSQSQNVEDQVSAVREVW